jgi:ABC-type multidrug transport system permease subunit
MGKTLALLVAQWRSARSFRLRMVFSIVALVASVVPTFYIANALQPFMASRIQGQGHEYFGFLLLGMACFSLLTTAVTALPNAIGAGISSGSFESMLATPIRLPELLAGMVAYDFTWSLIRAAFVLSAGAVLGADFVWTRALVAAGIIILIVAAYFPIGMIATALVLAFRTPGPLPQAVLLLSGLLGGVYFPTKVIPTWVQQISSGIPLSYGLRALRSVLIDGAPLASVARDLAFLAGLGAMLMLLAVPAFVAAMRYVRRAGTLTLG